MVAIKESRALIFSINLFKKILFQQNTLTLFCLSYNYQDLSTLQTAQKLS